VNCEKCDQENAASASFCTWCGTPLVPVIDHNNIPFRDLGQLINHTFSLYGKNFWQFVLIGLPPQILGLLALLIVPDVPQGFTSDFGSDAALEAAFEDWADAAPAMMLIGLASALATLIAQGATIHAVGRQYLGQEVDVSLSLKRGLSKSLILLIATLVAIVGLMASGALIVILIGIPLIVFLIISWAFIFPLIMIEGAGPISALSGSYNLVKGSRLRVLGIGIVFVLISFGIQVLISIATGIVDGVSQPLATVLSSFGMALLAPVMGIGLAVVYFDLRSRKEGMTVNLLAAEMGESVAGAAKSDDLRDR
jgi:hypothetical protein